jgi:hypothetical protein
LIGFILVAPIILPLTALKCAFTTIKPEETFEIDWLTFLKVYEGASNSDGSLRDLVR